MQEICQHQRNYSDNVSDDESQLMCDAKAAMLDVQDMNHSSEMTSLFTLHERVQMLNVEQKRI